MSGTPEPRRRRRAVLLLVSISLAGLALLVVAGLQGTLVYYRTPSAAGAVNAAGQRMRLEGEVVPGSVGATGELTRFRLSDGRHQVPVVVRGALPDTFREGQDAVVEGVLGGDGTLRCDQVAVKHSNEYRAAGEVR
ncbi:cytochrome c maturation protein CcmE [Amycolatopsis rhizosphaerae]|uniref:cytochrome c maturation protein CcmE n=1 Tax=Amycolatopsis rhizosphaerae TaxID=2053003 RepID=UPI001643F7E0|nr:cytochrome c maturation protein CcmE [Amycolatopsis rhizosphaerae]